MTTPTTTQDLIDRLRNGTAHLSLRQIEELWADAAGALEAVAKERQTTSDRFFIDHGQIHDRVTGRHVTTDEDTVFCDGINSALELLNGLASRITELQDEVVRMRAALEDVDANTPTQDSVVASRAHITPAQAECQQALANIGDIARAALDQQGDRG